MREDLLGYLLAALDPHEMRRVDRLLQEDPELRQELAEVERMLKGLDEASAAQGIAEASGDLVSRTLALIPHRIPSRPQSDPVSGSSSRGELVPETRVAALRPVTDRALNAESPRGRRSMIDVVGAVLAASILLALLFPTIARYRGEARNVACRDNLRHMGLALTQFVIRQRDAHLPGLAESGPRAFAGIYAVDLADSGLLTEQRLRWCPERDIPIIERDSERSPTGENAVPNAGTSSPSSSDPRFRLVAGADLHAAADKHDFSLLRLLQQFAGGHYAYSLGVIDNDHYDSPRYEGRSTFAVLGDAPIAGAHTADGVDVTKMRWSHRGNGANVLYEDGSVRHLHMPAMLELPDHPFVNHRGKIEAGVNIDDASLAPSWRAPFIPARQR